MYVRYLMVLREICSTSIYIYVGGLLVHGGGQQRLGVII